MLTTLKLHKQSIRIAMNQIKSFTSETRALCSEAEDWLLNS